MEIIFYGANCLKLVTKKANVIIDDNLKDLGLESITKSDDIVIITNSDLTKSNLKAKFVIDSPGEYEISGISVMGISARSHMDEADKKTAVIYKIITDDLRICITGHIYPDLNDQQLEELGIIDVLIIPVGGNGYTLDSVGALKVIKKIEPKLVIPTHFSDKAVKFEVPQQELSEAIKGLAMEPKETLDKLKIKSGELSETTQLIVLNRQ